MRQGCNKCFAIDSHWRVGWSGDREWRRGSSGSDRRPSRLRYPIYLGWFVFDRCLRDSTVHAGRRLCNRAGRGVNRQAGAAARAMHQIAPRERNWSRDSRRLKKDDDNRTSGSQPNGRAWTEIERPRLSSCPLPPSACASFHRAPSMLCRPSNFARSRPDRGNWGIRPAWVCRCSRPPGTFAARPRRDEKS
jgi:hypothetical protein